MDDHTAAVTSSLPPGVRIEMDRWRPALNALVGWPSTESDPLASRLMALSRLGLDSAELQSIVRRSGELASRLDRPGGPAAWFDALAEVAVDARPCLPALLESAPIVLADASPAEFLMWTRLGLRAWRSGSPGRAQAHFTRRSATSHQVLGDARSANDLATHQPRLTALTLALLGSRTRLHRIEVGVATQRAFVSNIGIHLPQASRALRGEAARSWYDACALHAAAHMCHSRTPQPRGTLKPVQTALFGVLEDARIEAIACQHLPGLRRLWLGFNAVDVQHGDHFAVLLLRLARVLLDPSHDDPHPWVRKARSLMSLALAQAGGPAQLAPHTLRHLASTLGHDIGQMRLAFNARDYVVEPSYRDDNAWLWAPPEDTPTRWQSTADPEPRARSESQSESQSESRSEPGSEPPSNPSAVAPRPQALPQHGDHGSGPGFSNPTPIRATPRSALEGEPLGRWKYPEWDRLIGAYRRDWCTVIDQVAPHDDRCISSAPLEPHRRLARRLARQWRSRRARDLGVLRAQRSGDRIDLDAALRAALDRRQGLSLDDRIYRRSVQRTRRSSVLLLIDASASTAATLPTPEPPEVPHASPVGGVGARPRTVLSLAIEASSIAASALRDVGERCAIATFHSNGRHEVLVTSALAFDEPLDDSAFARLNSVQSRYSTRMGAAIRHATQCLADEAPQRRIVILITDGEPHDIDIHDRRYLEEDARLAVVQARRAGVMVHCLATDPRQQDLVGRIFGVRGYRLLDRIEDLPRVLPQVTDQLAR